MNEHDSKPLKKTYRKPVLAQVELRPEEAVLGACKTAIAAGPAQSTCAALTCRNNGS